jgi:hypothetical protein
VCPGLVASASVTMGVMIDGPNVLLGGGLDDRSTVVVVLSSRILAIKSAFDSLEKFGIFSYIVSLSDFPTEAAYLFAFRLEFRNLQAL